MKVSDPTGQVWRVRRRWVPWRRRLTGWLSDSWGWASLGDDPISLIVFVVIGIPVLVITAIAFAELLLLLLLLPFVLLGRVLLGRHWTVEARKGLTIWWEETSGDWRASATRIADVAAAIERGAVPEQNVDRPDPAAPQ
ncbi:hypothetical protein [Nocardioides plantarum]|uniref:hypothetical protein n=1 Tax=Nocardioides plantarum TaxID=29299 RepID=UPI003623B3D9